MMMPSSSGENAPEKGVVAPQQSDHAALDAASFRYVQRGRLPRGSAPAKRTMPSSPMRTKNQHAQRRDEREQPRDDCGEGEHHDEHRLAPRRDPRTPR